MLTFMTSQMNSAATIAMMNNTSHGTLAIVILTIIILWVLLAIGKMLGYLVKLICGICIMIAILAGLGFVLYTLGALMV